MSKQIKLSCSQKKYLFSIYKLGQNGGVVKSSDVAKLVGVTKASTAIMTERLVESGFIEKEHYGRIELTESGIKAANPIFTNCVIIRDFLENTLGLDKKTADLAEYKYHYSVKIGGMTCKNCAARIENTFNRQNDVYAQVNFKSGSAEVSAEQIKGKIMR